MDLKESEYQTSLIRAALKYILDSKRIKKLVRRHEKRAINHLNCWEPLKQTKRQRNLEKKASVTVAKAEKICLMAYG